MKDAVTAAHLNLDPRPFLGLTEAHRGTTVERVLMQTVLDLVFEDRREVARQNQA